MHVRACAFMYLRAHGRVCPGGGGGAVVCVCGRVSSLMRVLVVEVRFEVAGITENLLSAQLCTGTVIEHAFVWLPILFSFIRAPGSSPRRGRNPLNLFLGV